MTLYIMDDGDRSVGFPTVQWSIECPFDHTADAEEREEFRKDMEKIYEPYCNGRIVCLFSGEQY